MENPKRWRYFEIATPNTFEAFEECSKLVKNLHQGFFPDDSWWNYYGDHIRFAVKTNRLNVVELVELIMQDYDRERVIPYVLKGIENPDLEQNSIEVCDQIDEIKVLVAKVAHEMGYSEPESKLSPTYTAYFIHLLMNALGHTYYSEAKVYSWLIDMVLNGMVKKDG